MGLKCEDTPGFVAALEDKFFAGDFMKAEFFGLGREYIVRGSQDWLHRLQTRICNGERVVMLWV